MLLETDPVPAVRMNRMCTGISNLGMAPGAGGADSVAAITASTGFTGAGGAANSSAGAATVATLGSRALACRSQAPPVLVAKALRAAFGTLLDPSATSSTRTRTRLVWQTSTRCSNERSPSLEKGGLFSTATTIRAPGTAGAARLLHERGLNTNHT